MFEIANEQTPFCVQRGRVFQLCNHRADVFSHSSFRAIIESIGKRFSIFVTGEKSWSNRAKFHRGNRGDAMKWWKKKAVEKLSEIYSTMPALGIVSIEADGEKSGGKSRIERIHR